MSGYVDTWEMATYVSKSCPLCLAEAGEVCTFPSGKQRFPHTARTQQFCMDTFLGLPTSVWVADKAFPMFCDRERGHTRQQCRTPDGRLRWNRHAFGSTSQGSRDLRAILAEEEC